MFENEHHIHNCSDCHFGGAQLQILNMLYWQIAYTLALQCAQE